MNDQWKTSYVQSIRTNIREPYISYTVGRDILIGVVAGVVGIIDGILLFCFAKQNPDFDDFTESVGDDSEDSEDSKSTLMKSYSSINRFIDI